LRGASPVVKPPSSAQFDLKSREDGEYLVSHVRQNAWADTHIEEDVSRLLLPLADVGDAVAFVMAADYPRLSS
jgi:hypothetical protein